MLSKLSTAISVAALVSSATATVKSRSTFHPLDDANRQSRTLVPAHAPLPPVLSRDYNPFQPKNNLSLNYVDADTIPSNVQTWGASVSIELQQPAVLTEQLSQLVSGVSCSAAGVTVNFASADATKQAQLAWTNPDFVVITLDASCNPEHTRAPYNVTKVDFDAAHNSALLTATLVQWADITVDLDLEYGDRAQDLSTVHPSAKRAVKRDSSKDIDLTLKDQTIWMERKPNYQIIQKCKDCEIKAHFELTKGSVKTKDLGKKITDTASDVGHTISDTIGHIFKRGTPVLSDAFDAINVDLTATGLSAKFDFETDVLGTHTFTYHILKTPISLIGFEIPGILSVGPMIDPVVVLNIKTAEPFKFSYGFDVKTPDNSKITLDLLKPQGSSVGGFQNTKFNMLPFETNIKNITQGIDVSLAFRPLFEIGLDLLTIKINPIVLFTDVPRYTGEIVLKHHIDKDCKPKAGSDALGISYNSTFGLDFGVGMDIQAASQMAVTPSFTLLKTSFAPMSTCFPLGNDAAAKVTTAAINPPKNTAKVTSAPKDTGKATSAPKQTSAATSPSAARKDAYTSATAKSLITTAPTIKLSTTPEATKAQTTTTPAAYDDDEECEKDDEEEETHHTSAAPTKKLPILPKRALAPPPQSVVTDVITATTTICPLTLTHTSGSSTYTVITSTVSTIKPTPTPSVSIETDRITKYTTFCPVTTTYVTKGTTTTAVSISTSVITTTRPTSTPTPTPSVIVTTDVIKHTTTICPLNSTTTPPYKVSVTTDVITRSTTICPLTVTSSAGAKGPTGSTGYLIPTPSKGSPPIQTAGATKVGAGSAGVLALLVVGLML